ncbi:protein LDOC1-like [Dendrobates tinctorius]|uniref:protein LDOC1-like n=1 Tax=Dendrobates tinctorius TaxID=92724 RepID=UPI003CC9234A
MSTETKLDQLFSMIHSLQGDIEALQNKVSNWDAHFGQALQDLNNQMTARAPPPSGQLLPVRPPKLPPFRFNGDHYKIFGFVIQCLLYFDLHATHFLTDRSKVLCIIMLLTSRALACANPLMETHDPRLNNLDDFLAAMSMMFDDPNRHTTAETALLSLH